MKIRSRHHLDQKRQCPRLMLAVECNFLPSPTPSSTWPRQPLPPGTSALTSLQVLLSPKHAKLVPRVQDSAWIFTPLQDALSCLPWTSAQTSPPQGLFFLLCVCVCTHMLSPLLLFATLWTVACQASLSLGLSRQEYWNGLPFPPPGHLPDPGIEPVSLMSPALQLLKGKYFLI